MNKFFTKLLALKANIPQRFEVKADASSDVTTLWLYDMIVSSEADAGWWGGVSAEAFAKEMAAITTPNIAIRMNCPGGDVFAGRAMQAAIAAHPANVTLYVDGYCASAATFLAMAADKVVMAEGAFFMIHKAWTYAGGNADDLIQTANLLGQIDDSIAASYSKKTGIAADEILQMMAAETWLSASDAVSKGFADESSEAVPDEEPTNHSRKPPLHAARLAQLAATTA